MANKIFDKISDFFESETFNKYVGIFCWYTLCGIFVLERFNDVFKRQGLSLAILFLVGNICVCYTAHEYIFNKGKKSVQ